MHASRRVLGPAVLAVGVAAGALVFTGSAAAASCAQVSITPGVQAPTLTPKTATITAGGCVAYTNNTALPVKISIGKLSDVANPNGVVTFVERAAGKFTVTAQEQFQGQGIGGTGTGTLVVKAAPPPKPSPRPTSSSPAPRPSSSSPHPSASATSSGPVVAPTQTPPTAPGVTPSPNQSGQNNPPVIVGMTTPSPSQPSSPAVIPRAQLQPPSGRATGLPAAIAALLVVGAAAAFVRVLLAEPAGGSVDGRFVPRPS
jgi:hypothetical protein